MASWSNIFHYLIIFVFTVSCGGQSTESKRDLAQHPEETEVSKTGIKKLPPLGDDSLDCVSGEVLVRFRDGTDSRVIEAIQTELNLKTIRIVFRPNLYLMRVPSSASVEEIIEKLQDFQEVAHAEPNYFRRAY